MEQPSEPQSKLMALESRLRNLEDLRLRILEMPCKVSYEQMIPLSKVAFCPGKLIHTNEFKVPDDPDSSPNLDRLPFISHIEAADKLQERLKKLEKQIESERATSSNPNFVKASTSTSSSTSTAAATSTATPTASKASEAPVHRDKPSTAATASSDKEQTPKSKGRVFEIREYLEGDGAESANATGGEVMDITEQIEKMEKFTSKPTGTVPGKSFLNEDETEFLKELAELSALGGEMDDDDEDWESAAAESGYSGKKRPLENLDEMFARIEAQQERQEELQRKKTQAAKDKAASGAGGGWKSGFLSGGKKAAAKPADTKADKPSAAVDVVPLAPPAPPAAAAASVAPAIPSAPKAAASPAVATVKEEPSRRVQFKADNDVCEIENREQLEQRIKEMKIEERKAAIAAARAQEAADAEAAIKAEELASGKPRAPPKKPFSGMILEKFP